jgi:flagellar FliL protein
MSQAKKAAKRPMTLQLRAGKVMAMTLGIFVLLGLVAGTGIGLLVGKRSQASAAEASERNPAKGNEKQDAPAVIHSLGEMVVNLADVGSLRYAKLSVALGIQEKRSEEELKAFEPPLRDAVIGVLTNKRFSELHQRNGVQKLKKELLTVCRARVPEAAVVEVYLEAFAMQ